jgi:hypothetical protein
MKVALINLAMKKTWSVITLITELIMCRVNHAAIRV